MSVVPIVLAAGASTRMGQPKALLDFRAKSALTRILQAFGRAGCSPAIVVVGHDRAPIRREARRLGAIAVENPDPDRGQLSSVQEALRVLGRGVDAFAVHPVDAPLVAAATIRALLDALVREAPGVAIVIPCHEGRRGHPGIFRRALGDEVLALAGSGSMRDVIHRDPARVLDLDVGDPHVLDRIDTPEDYESVLRSWRDAT